MSESSEPANADTASVASTLSEDDITAGLMAIGAGQEPTQEFLDHAGVTLSDISQSKDEMAVNSSSVSSGNSEGNALDYIFGLAATSGAKVIGGSGILVLGMQEDGKFGVIGGDMFEAKPRAHPADLSAGLTAASTPDHDNKNHEWRDGVKYVRGTTIVVGDAKPVVENPTRIASPWDKKDNA